MAQVNSNSAFSASKPPAKRLLPVLIGAAGAVLLGGGGILVGLNSKLTTLQTSAQQKDAEVSSSEQIAHRYQATLDNYNQTQTHIRYLESSISDRAYVPTLLAQIQALAAQTHLSVAAIRPTASAAPAAPPSPAPASGDGSGGVASASVKKAAPPPYDTMDVAVDVAGSYADTSMFLYSLTRFPKIVSVDNIQMHPGTAPKAGGPVPITTNLKLTAFMFHDAAAAPGAPPALPAASVPTVSVPAAAFVPPALTGAPPPAAGVTVSGSAGRAAAGAVSVTKAANSRSASQLSTL